MTSTSSRSRPSTLGSQARHWIGHRGSRLVSAFLLLGGLFLMLLSWVYIYGLSRDAGWLALAGILPLLAGIALHRSRWRLLVFMVGTVIGLSWLVLAFTLP